MALEQRLKNLKFHERIAREVLIVSSISQDYDTLQNVNKKSPDEDANVLKNENFGTVHKRIKSIIKHQFRTEYAMHSVSAMPDSSCRYRPLVLGVPDVRSDCWNRSMSAL